MGSMHEAPLSVFPFLLAAVLAVSGLAKLRSLRIAEEAFVSLRLPNWLRTLKAPQILPFAELVLAAGLMLTSGPLAVIVNTAAVLLFVAYLAIIVRALTFDEKVTCSCFGELGLGSVDTFTAVRNALLVGLSLVSLYDAFSGRSVIARWLDFTGAQWLWLLGVIVAAALTWLIAGHRGSDVSQVRTGLAKGARLTGELQRVDGSTVAIGDVTARGRRTLLAFVSPTCGSCLGVIEQLRTWQHEAENVTTYLVLPMRPTPNYAGLLDAEDFSVLFDADAKVMSQLQTGTPTAVVLDGKNRLLEAPAVGRVTIEQLLRTLDNNATVTEVDEVALAQSQQPTAPQQAQAATPAPDADEDDELDYLRAPNPYAALKTHEDTPVSTYQLVHANSGPAIFLLVSPGCGACEETMSKYDAWSEQLDPLRVFLVVSHEAARITLTERGFDAERILLDEQSSLTTMLQVGYPAMYAAGPDGKMLAGPVVGGKQVIETMDDIVVEFRSVNP